MNVDLAKLVEQLFADIFRSGQSLTAVQIQDATVAAGFSPSELDELDWQQVYDNACEYPGVPAAYKGAMQTAPSAPPPTVHTVVQEVQAIQQITNNNVNIIDQSNNIDNSVDFGNADFSDFTGDITIDNENAIAGDGGNANTGTQDGVAVGDGAAASVEGDAVATGDGSFVNTGTNVNTGNQVVGDENATVGGTTFDFGRGEGQPTILRDVEGGIPGVPGGVGDINLQTGDNSTQDNSETFQQNQTHGDNSPINNEAGDGDQNLDQQINQTFDAPEARKLEEFEPLQAVSLPASAIEDPADAV